MKILIVEDEKEIADGLEGILRKDGYDTTAVYDGESGYLEILSGIYDLVLLDVMLPKMDGFTIIRKIREQAVTTPIIFLTAKSQSEDKIHGLDLGADDYLTKPFDGGELLARIRARLRNNKETDLEDGTLVAFDIRLNPADYKLVREEKSVKLSKTEYQLLEYLMMNKGQILTKDMIINRVWGAEDESEYNNLEVYVSFLRKKLKFVDAKANIITKKGVGYALMEA